MRSPITLIAVALCCVSCQSTKKADAEKHVVTILATSS